MLRSAKSSSRWLVLSSFLASAAAALPARAQEPAQAERFDVPAQVSLETALQLGRTHGLDLLIADANTAAAEGDVAAAKAVRNPVVSGGYGRVFDYSPSGEANTWAASIGDQGAIVDLFVGKRSLRAQAARAALAAARLGRSDAQRVLEAQIKQQYVQVVISTAAVEFAKDALAFATHALELNRARFPKVIDEGQLARVETAKLEAEQDADNAAQDLQTARIGLAYLMGARGIVRDFGVDKDLLRFRVPAVLATATEDTLVKSAFERRPDLKAAALQRERADASASLARRERFPDVALSLSYAQTGTTPTAIQPPTVMVGLTTTLPIFYQQQGEVQRADADARAQTALTARTEAQVTADVRAAYVAFVSAKKRVERMEGGLLDRAKRARDVTEAQHNLGASSLMDYLDAQRTWVANNVEYLQDMGAYWTAIFRLEQAIGQEIKP